MRATLIEGFSRFVGSVTAPIVSGWNGCLGLALLEISRHFTASGKNRRYRESRHAIEPLVPSSAITSFSFNSQAFVCHELMRTHFYDCFWNNCYDRNIGNRASP